MLSSLNRANLPRLGFAVIFFAFGLLNPHLLPAQERYPAVARISFVSGPVSYSRGDDPDEWDDAIENVPLTIGDRIYSPEGGRAEVQLSSGNFLRLAPRSYFTTLNLGDDIKQFYLGEGAASFNIKRLQPDEVIEIDTPNVSVTLDEPGTYRIAVDEDGNSRITVRRGRVMVAASGRQIAVENSEIRVYGIDSPRYEIVGLPASDAFDRWASERDDRFERSYSDAYRYASDEIIGVEDLSQHGRWEQIPEYGYAWTPTAVAAGWVPFSVGRWFWQDPWGWTWISNDRWGWATSHYGRWTPYRSRWYWVPVRPRTRVRYVPAVVEFVRVRDHVGWFPLHPRDRYIPWWDRRDRRDITYVNRTYVTIVNQNTFISARPINKYIVRDSVIRRDANSGRFASESLPIPNRSSLRVISETAGRRSYKPSANVLNRAAVVRTAAPAPSFREKLPAIQKAQGKPIEPSQGLALTSAADKARPERVRIRPAAEEIRGKEFAPRNPTATSGPTPQPVTAARGKKLATRESVDSDLAEKASRAEKSPAPQPAPATPPEQNKGTATRPDAQTQERERQAQQQELERRKQEQQKEQQERKAQLQKQQEQRQQQSQERQEQRQKQRDLERRQAQQKEEERKAQPQKQQPAQDRRQEPQERQAPQQRIEELERKTQQREEERKSQLQQNRQEQERREQLRQQQQQREQHRNAQVQRQEQARAQQLRQQQAQEQRQAQQQQKQQHPRRRQPEPQQEQERKVPPQQP